MHGVRGISLRIRTSKETVEKSIKLVQIVREHCTFLFLIHHLCCIFELLCLGSTLRRGLLSCVLQGRPSYWASSTTSWRWARPSWSRRCWCPWWAGTTWVRLRVSWFASHHPMGWRLPSQVSVPTMSDAVLGWVAGRQGEGGADAALRHRHQHAAAVALRDAAADGHRRLIRLRHPGDGHRAGLLARSHIWRPRGDQSFIHFYFLVSAHSEIL